MSNKTTFGVIPPLRRLAWALGFKNTADEVPSSSNPHLQYLDVDTIGKVGEILYGIGR